MRTLDLTSWHGVLSSLLGLALFALIGVGIRVLLTMTIQQRRERSNRQINERLKTLMAAYKALGGSFTGTLTVDPSHLREIRQRSGSASPENGRSASAAEVSGIVSVMEGGGKGEGSDRARRIRDAVEAALSDILLLGTESQVRLAAKAVAEMVEGRPIHTAELVVSLRDFIRKALDLDPIPADVKIPLQGPTRPSGGGGGSGGNRSRSGNKSGGDAGGGHEGGRGGGGSGARAEAGIGEGGAGFRMKPDPDEEDHAGGHHH